MRARGGRVGMGTRSRRFGEAGRKSEERKNSHLRPVATTASRISISSLSRGAKTIGGIYYGTEGHVAGTERAGDPLGFVRMVGNHTTRERARPQIRDAPDGIRVGVGAEKRHGRSAGICGIPRLLRAGGRRDLPGR